MQLSQFGRRAAAAALRPNWLNCITYDLRPARTTSSYLFQKLIMKSTVMLICQSTLEMKTVRILSDNVFLLRPRVGEILTLLFSITHYPVQVIHLLITRATQ